MKMEKPKLLILLVGSNPLPNCLVARALQPERIALVYTKETEGAMKRLLHVLKDKFDFLDPPPFVEDATCAETVEKVIRQLVKEPERVHLNYTGGTKVMAAHARMAFQEGGGSKRNASYLDEGIKEQKPRLRFDDGTSEALSEFEGLAVSFPEILKLHGMEYKPRTPKDPAPKPEDAEKILAAVLKRPDLAEKLDKEKKRLEKLKKLQKSVEDPFLPEKFGLSLSLPQVPIEGMKKKCLIQWYKFIGGEWLEEWVTNQIKVMELNPKPDITTGINIINKKNFEVDVAVLRFHRTYFISCTTSKEKSLCKSKMFEIAVRSRQLGGDLARSALVCMADGKDVDALRTDIDDVWDASNTPRIFGLSDIRSWAGEEGFPPNTFFFKEWLES